jgi:hypothetical protein
MPILLITTPLILSGFTHLWNPIGFPYVHGDEGHYLRRAMHVLQGLGPQETKMEFDHPFDHPYFGQLFLGGIFWIIGYPHFINISDISLEGLKQSVEQLYLVPREIMGFLALADTFLIYKITERKYSRKAGFLAAILFAVMPLTWLTRRTVLESILLPFILCSILCAVYLRTGYSKDDHKSNNESSFRGDSVRSGRIVNKGHALTLLSGLLLGLAIFTKITAIMIIPLVVYLIFVNSNKSFKVLGLWFFPVVLIPMIWPAYALLIGQFQDWADGISWQSEREGRGLMRSFNAIFRIDPALWMVGLSSVILVTAVKKDPFLLLWIIPFLLFYSSITFIQHFHWILLLPMLCIAAGVCISDLLNKISAKSRFSINKVVSYSMLSAFFLFGLVSTTLLITTNINTSLFEAQALIIKIMPHHSEKDKGDSEEVTLMGSNWMQIFSWIPQYIFNMDHAFKAFAGANLPVEHDKRVLLLVDGKDLKRFIIDNAKGANSEKEKIYNNTQTIAEVQEKSEYYKKYRDRYPYTSIHENRGIEGGKIIMKADYIKN